MIQVRCHACGKTVQVEDSYAGRQGKCLDCGTMLTVPAVSGGSAVQPSASQPTVQTEAVVTTAPVMAAVPASTGPNGVKIICSSCGTVNVAVPALGQTSCGKCGVDLLTNTVTPTASQPQVPKIDPLAGTKIVMSLAMIVLCLMIGSAFAYVAWRMSRIATIVVLVVTFGPMIAALSQRMKAKGRS